MQKTYYFFLSPNLANALEKGDEPIETIIEVDHHENKDEKVSIALPTCSSLLVGFDGCRMTIESFASDDDNATPSSKSKL
jgi:hypothetical protein